MQLKTNNFHINLNLLLPLACILEIVKKCFNVNVTKLKKNRHRPIPILINATWPPPPTPVAASRVDPTPTDRQRPCTWSDLMSEEFCARVFTSDWLQQRAKGCLALRASRRWQSSHNVLASFVVVDKLAASWHSLCVKFQTLKTWFCIAIDDVSRRVSVAYVVGRYQSSTSIDAPFPRCVEGGEDWHFKILAVESGISAGMEFRLALTMLGDLLVDCMENGERW